MGLKINNVPMVPAKALERAQGELKTAYAEIAELHLQVMQLDRVADAAREMIAGVEPGQTVTRNGNELGRRLASYDAMDWRA